MKLMPLRTGWTVIAIALVGATATDTAYAGTSFDGSWTVLITTQRGACSSGSSFGLEIRDGAVYGNADSDVRGRTAHDGTVHVRVTSGDQIANGSGRLSSNSGGGTWFGVGSRGTCSGRWSASRQGNSRRRSVRW
jgi:hypothetical protein